MGILRVDHPDILEFITCKDKTNEITNFNISVAITDKFMESLKSGTKYDLVNPRNNQIAGQLDAREVLDKIAFQAWKNGEPGLFFIDENNRRQPTPHVADMEATNPCGEQPLLPYESCNLGSIDLARHMKRNAAGRWDIDWSKLEGTIRTTVRMLDDVIEHAHRRADRPLEFTPVDVPATRRVALHVPREIDGTEVAGFVRQERLFTAWVRRLHVRDVRSWLAAVVLINEEQAGLPVLPGLVRDFV